LHHKKYVEDILKKFIISNCNLAIIPMKTGIKLSKETNNEPVNDTFYMKIIGSLIYMCNTSPYINHNVGIVSRFMERCKTCHLIYAKRILRYIKDTIEYGYSNKNAVIYGYSDTNRRGDQDYLFMISATSISQSSKKQKIVVLSSCEVEYCSRM